MVFKLGKKKYKIRKFSPIWWAGAMAIGVIMIVGFYCWMAIAYTFGPTTI